MAGLNILPIVRKEFRQIRRDRRALGVLLFVPAMMLGMFGYALTFDVKHTSMGIYDQDRTRTSREFANLFFISEHFDRVVDVSRDDEVDRLLDSEGARGVVIIPRGFTEAIASGRSWSCALVATSLPGPTFSAAA